MLEEHFNCHSWSAYKRIDILFAINYTIRIQDLLVHFVIDGRYNITKRYQH